MPEREPDKVDVYMALFRGREDVYARRWENGKKGIAGYAPVRRGEPGGITAPRRAKRTGTTKRAAAAPRAADLKGPRIAPHPRRYAREDEPGRHPACHGVMMEQ